MKEDPVCHRDVDEIEAIEESYGDAEYYFCSEACLEEFRRNPTEYVEAFERSPVQGEPHEHSRMNPS